MLSEEHLQRPLIKGIVYKTDKDEIRVQDDCTVFIQIRNCRKVTLQEVQAHFRQLKQEASASGKVKLKGATKFLPAVRQLYPAYCASCDKIERIFAELTELVRQIERDGIHMGYSDDELLEAAIWKQFEITRYYYRNTDYSRFLDYNDRICKYLRDKPWQDENIVACTIPIA